MFDIILLDSFQSNQIIRKYDDECIESNLDDEEYDRVPFISGV